MAKATKARRKAKPKFDPRWKITDNRQTHYPIAVNGKSVNVPANVPVKLSAEQRAVLNDSGIAYEEVTE